MLPTADLLLSRGALESVAMSVPSRHFSNRICLVAMLACLLGAGAVSAADSGAGAFDGEIWMQGADGLYEAIRVLEESPQAMVVYFYTDWCGYCRQFERELLGTSEVKEYFEDVLTVRINPEQGADERKIADYYGVQGYPGFFVHSGHTKTLSRVERMKLSGGEPRIMSPGEFIGAVAAAAAR